MGRFCSNQVDVWHKVSGFQHLQLGRLCPSGHIGECQRDSATWAPARTLSPILTKMARSSLNEADVRQGATRFQDAWSVHLCPSTQMGERQQTSCLEPLALPPLRILGEIARSSLNEADVQGRATRFLPVPWCPTCPCAHRRWPPLVPVSPLSLVLSVRRRSGDLASRRLTFAVSLAPMEGSAPSPRTRALEGPRGDLP